MLGNILKLEDNQMSDFNNLETLYAHLEEAVLTYDHYFEITDLFKKFRDARHEENNVEEAEKAQWEIHYLSFNLEEGEIGPEWQQTDKNGQVFVYPHLGIFDDKIYEYLIMRLDATNHPKLKARYAHILWSSPKKHRKYAETTVDSYLELIPIYEQRCENDKDFCREIAEVVMNAYAIACKINYEVDKVKSELQRLIQKFSSDAAFSAWTLITYMLKPKKGFTKKDFDGLQNICWQIAESFSDDGHTAINFLKLGEKVDQRLEKQSHDWIFRIAQHYETQMKQREKSPMVALHFCTDAIKYYRRVGDEEKIRELEKRYSEFKDSMEFHTTNIDIDITEIVRWTRDFARDFVKNASSDEIIGCLITDKIFLPTVQEAENSVKEQIKKSPLLHLLPKVISDQSRNTAQHFETDDEKKYHSLLESYQLQLEMGNTYLINSVLTEAISERKLSIDILLDFLNKNCWYGKIPNWLNLIAPALNEYFRQVDFYLADPIHNFPNFVLSLDSLTLKIEGLFRHLCQLSGVTTSRHKQDNSGRNIAQEKDIDALLREDLIQKLFDEDDLLFFKFLLVEKCGYNLRHKIAHTLLPFQTYNWHYMNLMILALLRLGKYDFVQENEEQDDSVSKT